MKHLLLQKPLSLLAALLLAAPLAQSCGHEAASHSDARSPRLSHPSATREAHASAHPASPAALPDGLGAPRGHIDQDVAPTPRDDHPLQRFYSLLEVIERPDAPPTRVRILQIGDSHTASDTFTGPLREALQERFGDGGRGYLFAGTPWSSYRQRDASYSMTAGWSGGVGIRGGANEFSLGGARIYTDLVGEVVERGPCRRCTGGREADHLRIHYLRAPEGGDFEVRVDDEAPIRIETRADATSMGVFEMPLAMGEHTLRIESLGGGRVTLFGTSFEDSRGGVIVDSLGVNGAQLRHFLSFNDALTKEEVQSLQPDLLILAFGANEAMSSRYQVRDPKNQALELLEKLQAYRFEILELLERYRSAAPNAECLLLLPPDMLPARSSEGCEDYHFESEELSGVRCVQQPPYNYAGIINAQRFAAMTAGCAVWDQQRAMGGEGAMDIWRELRLGARDGVHLRSSGYDQLAEGFFADLMQNYERWRSGDVEPLSTTVIFPQLATSARDGQ